MFRIQESQLLSNKKSYIRCNLGQCTHFVLDEPIFIDKMYHQRTWHCTQNTNCYIQIVGAHTMYVTLQAP